MSLAARQHTEQTDHRDAFDLLEAWLKQRGRRLEGMTATVREIPAIEAESP